MEIVDTHCHLHFAELLPHSEKILASAKTVRVTKMICVGVSLKDSKRAIEFAAKHPNVWASAGAHPHGSQEFLRNRNAPTELAVLLKKPKVVGVGEIGLDYYREHAARKDQQTVLRTQIEIGLKTGLPFIFHVRDAWSDFWPIFDEYQNLKGVVHSFTGGTKQLEQALSRGLFVALNGITTYTRDQALLEAAKKVPLNRLLLETDAPFLTPLRDKSKTCEPKHTRMTAEFLAELRQEKLENLAAATTLNAIALFGLEQAK